MTDENAKGGTGTLPPGALTALLEAIAREPLPAEESLPPPLLPGSRVGRYEIVRELDRGAFGVVHEARDRELGRSVALKLVRPGRLGVGEAQLAREAEAIARLSHPNLVTVHDIGQSEHGPYLVFELLRGETLQERLDRDPVPVKEAVRLALEVARGLAHAHAEGVVHRDLKPSNVFVTAKGQVKLLDFGMAHAFGRKRVSGGTPAYMAPEQWEGDPEDERTDVFALGVMLYRMLTGEHPFSEDGGKRSSGPAEPPRLLVAGVPELEDLVSRMLSKAPRGRPRDGGEALAALVRIAGSLPAGEASGSLAVQTLHRKATLGDLWAELRRRRVFRALIGYGIFSFAVLQVTEPVLHGVHLPDWVLTAVLIALAIGFPITVVLAWIFDFRSTGIERTAAMPQAAPSRTRITLLLAAVAVLTSAPVAVYFLVPSRRWAGTAATPQAVPSIAVLPFADMSPGKDQEYFSDGMAEEILNALAHVEGLRVIGRTSSFYFKGRNEDLASISRKLGVGAVLEGSVRREANRVRVTAQLIEASDGSHVWSEAYDREVTSIFQVQEDIARAVVAALQVKLLPSKGPTTRAAQTSSQEAYDLVLRARHVGSALTRDGYIQEHALLEQAAALDPAYAMPHAVIGASLRLLAFFAGTEAEAASLRKRALAEADRAVQLGPELDDAYSLRAVLRIGVQHDWTGAEADLRRALALSPSHPSSLRRMGILLAELGRIEEGIGWVERSARLDPLRGETWNWLGVLQFAAGRPAEARASLARSREVVPSSPEPRSVLALLEIQQGNPSAAIALVPSLRDADALEVTALAEHDLGHEEASQRALDQLIFRHGHVAAHGVARVYAWRGDLGPAFGWLDRMLGQEFLGLKWDPMLRKIRGDPRYAALLQKVKLPAD